VAREAVQELEMSVDEALKMLLSMGAVMPDAEKSPSNSLAEVEARS
jgi:uncharacterized membrane protein